jgi:hypothetical protein
VACNKAVAKSITLLYCRLLSKQLYWENAMLLNLKRWLLASGLCSIFLFVSPARAAEPPSRETSRTTGPSVKLQLPTFIAFGLGGISAGGAVATGYIARRGNDPASCDSRCTERAVTQKRLLLTTGVLAGMAATGVGIGITLMLKAPRNPRRDAIRPRFDLGLSGEKAVAKVGWVFSSF